MGASEGQLGNQDFYLHLARMRLSPRHPFQSRVRGDQLKQKV